MIAQPATGRNPGGGEQEAAASVPGARLALPRRPLPWLVLMLSGMIGFELLLGLCVQEDAFISFRYARNLVEGHGLVYNAGERVEGYTNFLWTVAIAGGMRLGLDPVPLVRFGGMGAGVALVLLVWAAARARDRRRGLTGGLVAAAVVATSPQLAAEAVQGLETVPFALLTTAGVLLQASGRDREAAGRSSAGLLVAGALVLAISALMRPEGVGVFGLSFLGGVAWRPRSGLPVRWRVEALAAGAFLLVYLPYWLWRFDYYGYPLPNTFYAKTGGGLRHTVRGLAYLGRFLLVHPGLTIGTAAVAWAATRRPAGRAAAHPDRRAAGGSSLGLTVACVVAGYLAYVAAVGGDFKWTFRFILPVLPLWALLLDEGIGLALAARPGLLRGWPRRLPGVAAAGLWLVLGGLALDALIGAPASARWARQREWDLVRRTALGLHLAERARPGEVLAIHSAGIVPYHSGLPTIDMWGLNDVHIAHLPIPEGGPRFAIGHEKRDREYVFARLPKYFVDEWFCVRADPVPTLARDVFGDPPQPWQGALYRARSVPVVLDDGRGPRPYFLNYLELDEEAARAAGGAPAR